MALEKEQNKDDIRHIHSHISTMRGWNEINYLLCMYMVDLTKHQRSVS